MNKFYANTKYGVVKSTPASEDIPIRTNLSLTQVIEYIGYYQAEGMSFREALKIIERM